MPLKDISKEEQSHLYLPGGAKREHLQLTETDRGEGGDKEEWKIINKVGLKTSKHLSESLISTTTKTDDNTNLLIVLTSNVSNDCLMKLSKCVIHLGSSIY